MVRAVIFDLDGTMVNTEVLWADVMERLAPQYGKKFDHAVRVKMMGKRDHEALTAFKEHHDIDASVDELVEARRKIVLAETGVVKTNPGLFELLDLLDRLNIKKAIATSAFKQFATNVLRQFDLEKRFDAIVTADQVTHSKPDPEIYLEAAKRLGVDPSECLVLEDAQIGVESAYRAGMKVFAIPHEASMHHDFSHATRIISSMSDITEETLRTL